MKIVLLGSGNVATHLAKELFKAKHCIVQVYSRRLDNAELVAKELEAKAVCQLDELDADADLYIVSVKDDALSEVINNMPLVNGLVVHTAGSVGMNALSRFTNFGVFYPFQTFTKEAQLDFSNIPVLVESNSDATTNLLINLGRTLSKVVLKADSEQRGKLHIAAVFACNFVNHMYCLADELLKSNQLPFDLLHPLIMETAIKVQKASPTTTQTGPASRKDKKIIDKHQQLLHDKDELSEIYSLLTDSILKRVK
ncbi:Rossmann-like and DUF2520 domain-containing protein [Carboxylicivirga marina]|uniref:Rossmann-like and DUF2520 domain-containing protein n=1 Tax=Carboxylicivirga marina TaxID=2800988 RepID=UPI0025967262|nr:DUF2520 domain-containing protein [uncultured Carboxylicivirga sp.]